MGRIAILTYWKKVTSFIECNHLAKIYYGFTMRTPARYIVKQKDFNYFTNLKYYLEL